MAEDLELVVHTDQHVLDVAFSAEGAARCTDTRVHRVAECAKAHLVVFEERRPMRPEHPLGASASRPTGLGI